MINPPNAEATFVQSTRMQRFLTIILTLSCCYSFNSSQYVLPEEYPCARVLNILQLSLHHFVLAKLTTTSIRVKTRKMKLIMTLSSIWCVYIYKAQKKFVSCNLTLTSFYSKKPYRKFFSPSKLPINVNMHITHIFDQKNNQKFIFTDLPTLFFSDRYRKQTVSFLGLRKKICYHLCFTTYL